MIKIGAFLKTVYFLASLFIEQENANMAHKNIIFVQLFYIYKYWSH